MQRILINLGYRSSSQIINIKEIMMTTVLSLYPRESLVGRFDGYFTFESLAFTSPCMKPRKVITEESNSCIVLNVYIWFICIDFIISCIIIIIIII